MSELFEALKERLKQEQGVALATVVRGPYSIGAKLLIYADQSTRGTLGLPALDALALQDARQALWNEADARIFTYTIPDASAQEHFEVFIEGFPPPQELIIVGAGHIAIALTTIAKALNYHVVVIDARAAFATRERFPNADELIVAWPDEILQQRVLSPATAIAILTHDPKFDEPTLQVVLSRQVGYIGAIGSRHTSAERAERLKQQGLSEDQLARIHGPIGLDIGAVAPAEIALAIMAEIIAVRHGKDQQHRRITASR